VHRHQVLLGGLPGNDDVNVAYQINGNPDAGDQTDGVLDRYRQAGSRKFGLQADDRLLQAALEDQPADAQQEQAGDDDADFLACRRQALDERVDTQVGVFLHGDHGAQEGQPDKQDARHFLGNGDSGIKAVAQHDVAEHQHQHDRQEQHDQAVEQVQHVFFECFHCSPHVVSRVAS
jgi:hypothetical protein